MYSYATPVSDRPNVDAATRGSRALAHPIRARIVAVLGDGELSPVELAKALDISLGVVSYHVRMLADAGVLELARTTSRRGAIQHHYRRARSDDRYCDSVELRPRAAERLLSEISAAIERAQRRSAKEDDDGSDERVALTVLMQPASAGDEAAPRAAAAS
jgi:DNA-binding transcriptional ArsR family regulator